MNSLSVRVPVFEEAGHFTSVPNALFDWVQPLLSLSAWSVLCVIVRRTRGWGKSSDAISYEQIKKATGIRSDTTVAKALCELLSKERFGQSLICRHTSDDYPRRGEVTCYAFNPQFEVEVAREDTSNSTSENGDDFISSPEYEVETVLSPSENGVEAANPSPFSGGTKERIHSSSRSLFDFRFNCANRVEAENNPTFPDLPETPLFRAVCAATQRDPTLVSPKMCAQLAACADKLARAGYDASQVELAAQRWPLATAPYPSQLLDNIQALLAARPTSRARLNEGEHEVRPSDFDALPHATHPSRASRSVAGASPRTSGGAPAARFENAAERKGRKWAQWLDAIA